MRMQEFLLSDISNLATFASFKKKLYEKFRFSTLYTGGPAGSRFVAACTQRKTSSVEMMLHVIPLNVICLLKDFSVLPVMN